MDCVTEDQLIGKKYGRLQVISFSHRDKKSNRYYTCRCECGSEKVVGIQHLKSGSTLSCGCIKKATVPAHIETTYDYFGLEQFIKKYIESAGLDSGIFCIMQIINQIIAGSQYTCKLVSNSQLPQRC